jgi:hypothetical protein
MEPNSEVPPALSSKIPILKVKDGSGEAPGTRQRTENIV